LLQDWELLVLSKLKWTVTAVTGFDYVDHVLERVEWSKENPLIRRHAHTLVGLCYTGKFSSLIQLFLEITCLKLN